MRYLNSLSAAALLLFSGVGFAQASATPQSPIDPLISKLTIHEKQNVLTLSTLHPVVETYLQYDKKGTDVPTSDVYFLSRLKLDKSFVNENYREKQTHASPFVSVLGGAKRVVLPHQFEYEEAGLPLMLFPDVKSFDQSRYRFALQGHTFLGSVHIAVYDVEPIAKHADGMFKGRIYVDDTNAQILRFTGVFAGGSSSLQPRFIHFDSWRSNVRPNLWLPVGTYIEEMVEGGKLNGQTRLWGYESSGPAEKGEETTVRIDAVEDRSDDSADVGPLEALRDWRKQSEDNQVERLEKAGLISPAGKVEKELEQIATNIAIPNNLSFPGELHCRILLTSTIESTTIGNTILVSKGLLDTVPGEEAIAAILAFQLAHIELSDPVNTAFAFHDRLMFGDSETYLDLPLAHSHAADAKAGKRAAEYLKKTLYAPKLDIASLYFAQAAADREAMPSIFRPQIGDGVLSEDGKPWVKDLAPHAPKLLLSDLTQVAALPLNSLLHVDPWTSSTQLLHAPRLAPATLAEKRPFQVLPLSLRPSIYKSGSDAGAASTTPAPTITAN